MLRFAEGYYRSESRSPTVGAFFLAKRLTVHSNMTCKMLLWDTAGQDQFQKLAITYYKSAAAAILAYDVSNSTSIQKLYYWLNEVQKNTADRRIVIAIVACKGDLEPIPGLEEDAQRLAASVNAIYVKTSAKDNIGVHGLFKLVAERVLEWHEEYVIQNAGNNNSSSEYNIHNDMNSIPVKVGGVVANVQRCRSTGTGHAATKRTPAATPSPTTNGNSSTSLFRKTRTSPSLFTGGANPSTDDRWSRTTTPTPSLNKDSRHNNNRRKSMSPLQKHQQQYQQHPVTDTESSEEDGDNTNIKVRITSSTSNHNRRGATVSSSYSNGGIDDIYSGGGSGIGHSHSTSKSQQQRYNNRNNNRTKGGGSVDSHTMKRNNVICEGGLMACGVPEDSRCTIM